MGTALVGVLTGVIPTPTTLVSTIPSLGPLFGVAVTHIFDFPGQVFTPNMLIVVLTFLFVSFFDTAGTLIGVAERAGLMENNRLKREGRALFSDSLSIVTGAIVGTSPTNAYIESTTGIDVGIALGLVIYPVTMVIKGRARELPPIARRAFPAAHIDTDMGPAPESGFGDITPGRLAGRPGSRQAGAGAA